MTEWLLPIAAKSFLVAGAVLLVLKLAQHRSAADRSWIAHLGLASVLLLPIAAYALPSLDVAGPAVMTEAAAPAPSPALPAAVDTGAGTVADTFPGVAPALPTESTIDWLFWAYAAPGALLLLLTLIALMRLIPLKARATVLVEPHWLSALAHAQRRMGFKSGTALLTSEDLPSPISWGLVRPVILLNNEATKSHEQAEAIIAHELAHVANLDWAKLLVARIACALFWFNPLVWLLAREAHQLREEAADDAVLASDIEDTDYANLLVGVARHECRGLLIGAHGVAPARNSLARRVSRVLNGALSRAPGGWRWTSAAAFFAAGMAVPVAALNFVPTTPVDAVQAASAPIGRSRPFAPAARPAAAPAVDTDEVELEADAVSHADVQADVGDIVRDAVRSADIGARASAVATAHAAHEVDALIGARAVGVTADYATQMRAAAPGMANADLDDLSGLRVHRVQPDYVRELQRLGFREVNADEVTAAAVQGVTIGFARSIAAAGYSGISVEQLTEMKMFGVTPGFIERLRGQYGRVSAQEVVEARLTGLPPG